MSQIEVLLDAYLDATLECFIRRAIAELSGEAAECISGCGEKRKALLAAFNGEGEEPQWN